MVWFNTPIYNSRSNSRGNFRFTPLLRSCNRSIKEDPILGFYREDWKTKFLQGEPDMADYIRNSEQACVQCSEERQRRHRVLTDFQNIPSSLTKSPFTSAPALYSFNVPRYFSSQLRVREFANSLGATLKTFRYIQATER